MKAILHFDATSGVREELRACTPDWLDVVVVSERDEGAFLAEMADADALWHALEPVTARYIEAGPQLRLVQKIGVGVNTIDLDTARARGVGVANMPGSNSQAVAEHALMLLLAVKRRVRDLDASVRRGDWWALPAPTIDAIGEIGGATVGLVGYGAVPQRLAPVLRALGARVQYWTRKPQDGVEDSWCESLEDLLTTSDVVSLHVPLVAETERLLDAAAFAAMRPGAVLVNTARGGLVDEDALVAALTAGQLRGAGLDVFADEPIGADHPLCALDNVVLTPHVAWLTPETWARSFAVAIENCRRVRDGEPLQHEIVPYRG